jgi:hypothetical protein
MKRLLIFPGLCPQTSGPAVFASPLPDIPSRFSPSISMDEVEKAINRHSETSGRLLDYHVGQMSPNERHAYLNNARIPAAIRASLQQRFT